ncbi:hypothetical protein [Geotalea sp. SG265]|uniref:hypothetical protein n=1 Tax=Geotalea sp. SG265 TaxID=2922867 RepID=UPI001FAF699F|nr:hypothetical protein [Geotalea sp. SG265]
MIHAKRNFTTVLVVSLLLAVISLSGAISSAAVAPPGISARTPIRDGMLTPVRMALHPSGNYIYVTDARNQAVLKYNLYGRLLKTFKTAGIPLGVALTNDASPKIIVTQGKYVAILDPVTGAEITRVGEGVIGRANGVAVNGFNGDICVTDGALNKVHVFDSTGATLKKTFGGYGLSDSTGLGAWGLFFNPSGIAYEKDAKRIVVADTANGRIQFFDATDPNYPVVNVIGKGLNDAPMNFVSVQGFAFEYDQLGKLKRLYVVDTWKGGIQVIDPVTVVSGTYLSFIGAGSTYYAVGGYPYGVLSGAQDYQFLLPTDAQFDSVYGRLLVVSADSSIKILDIDGRGVPVTNDPLAITINPSPENTNVSTYSISGTLSPAYPLSDVTLSTDTGAVAGAVTYDGTGRTWSAVITGLTLGANKITALATDVEGIKKSAVKTVVYTMSAPSLTITTPANTVTSELSAILEGTVEAGCTVTIRNNTTQTDSVATITGAGTTWTGTSLLRNNTANSFTVTATKPGYNTASAGVTIISDTTAPLLNISALPDGSFSSGTMTQNISGYVQDANPSTVSVTVNSGAATVVSTPLPAASFSVPVTLQPGANTITVQATDLGGKTSFVNTRTINYDATRPVLAIDATPADNSFTRTASASLSGSVTPVDATVTVTNNGVAVAGVTNTAGSWSVPITLTSGQNTLVATATSGAKEASLKRTVTLDSTAPALAITAPANDIATNLPNIEVSGTISGDADGYPALVATINATPVTPAPAVNNGTFTFNTGASLVAGANLITVTATDSAGNATSVTRSVNYDTVAPSLTLVPSAAGYPKNINGTVEASASVSVTDGAKSFAVTINGTSWSADLTTSSYNAGTIQIKATDAAGNISVITGLTYNKPDGDIDQNGVVDANDAQLARQLAMGVRQPTAAELAHGDIGPLLKGAANPNGKIDLIDAILIQRKAQDSTFSW